LLFSSARDARDCALQGFPIPPAVAPLGVDVQSCDAIAPLPRTELGAPATGLLVCCRYETAARARIGNVFRTLATLAQRHRGIHLVMVGHGSDDADLRMHAAALGVNPIISFLGAREDEIAVLRAADIGWVVADFDDGAFACLDFMAMRIPVLAERGAMPQHYVADGIAGVLLAPADPAITAAAVAAFIANTERRAAMGAAGRTRVMRDFTESAMIDAFERAGLVAADRSRWSAR
jgi:glycosyltransferase involved in cell wall biosynthesis